MQDVSKYLKALDEKRTDRINERRKQHQIAARAMKPFQDFLESLQHNNNVRNVTSHVTGRDLISCSCSIGDTSNVLWIDLQNAVEVEAPASSAIDWTVAIRVDNRESAHSGRFSDTDNLELSYGEAFTAIVTEIAMIEADAAQIGELPEGA